MGHFEEDISAKPDLHVSAPGSFTLVEITKPIFPNKNPKKEKEKERENPLQNETWFVKIENSNGIPVPLVPFTAIKSSPSIIPPEKTQCDLS